MVSPEVIRHHLNYTAWASAKLVEAAGALSDEELRRDHGTSDKHVLGTLVHVYAADRIWLGRIQAQPRATFIDDADYSMDVLRADWPALHARWSEWAAGLTDEAIASKVDYKDLRGNPYSQPLWQILLHVVNHGTHHRGQVSGFLRAMGHKPPALDLIAYYRQL